MKTGKMKELWPDAKAFRIEVIESIIPESGNILDIGLGKFKYDTKKCEYITLDIKSPEAKIRGTAESLPFKSDSFDLVISTEVIEHVRYPKKMLEEVRRVMRKNGKWLMSTPNVATLMNRFALLFFGRFIPDRTLHDYRDVGHIHFWDNKYLLEVLSQNGFEVVRSWHRFFQIWPGRYISTKLTDRLFKNLCEQNMFLCRKV